MKSHRTVAVFIPHRGCKNNCVFCDQKTITGVREFDPEQVKAQLAKVFSDPYAKGAQIAFFGGSFTAIDRKLMCDLLSLATDYYLKGLSSGIRLSTRPDAVNSEIISILKSHPVKAVELGIQSTDDGVLRACQRGCDTKASFEGARLVKEGGFEFTAQMMIGLPSSTLEKEMNTANDVIKMGADCARVYPTVVFDGTVLGKMAQNGEYSPLEEEDAVNRGAEVCGKLISSNVRLLRVGLCESDELHSPKVLGGANFSSYGEMVYSRIYLMKLLKRLEETDVKNKALTVLAAPNELSRVCGYKRINKKVISQRFSPSSVSFRGDRDVLPFDIKLQIT